MNLAEAATRLYAVPSDQFVAERTALVAAARAAKDKALVTAIGGLRKPSVAAWLANQLARQHPEQLARLTELGERISSAQQEMAGDRLRETGKERSALLEELMAAADALGRDAGVPVSPAVARDLHDTFTAALASPAAASAVASGRLTRSLSYSGLGDVDLTAAVPDVGAPPAKPAEPTEPVRPNQPTSSDTAAETAKAEANAAALAEAEADVQIRTDARVAADVELEQAREQRQKEEERLKELEVQVAEVKKQLAAAQLAEQHAARARKTAVTQVNESEATLRRLSARA